MTHQLRAAHEAIVVGIGTVLSDDPQLTVRLVEGRDPQPVILDSHLAFPERARLLENITPPWIAVVSPVNLGKEKYLAARGARVLHLPSDTTGRIELIALLAKLGELNITSILVEGGARLITSFLQCRMVDRVVVTISPLIVGGLKVVEEVLVPMPRLGEFNSLQLGEDVIVWGTPKW
jgi:riboflavin-specific deaminase-like protein